MRKMLALAAAGLLFASAAAAQDAAANFPNRPIRIIVLRAGRRRRRYRHPAARQRPAGPARAAGGGGEPRRRRRQYRRRGRVHRRSRRLHALGGTAVAAHHQSAALQGDAVRSGEIRAGHDHDHGRQRAAGAARFPGQDRAGIHRLCQGQPRQGELCLAGHRHHLAPDGGAVRTRDRHVAGARALQGHHAGAQRIDRRATST